MSTTKETVRNYLEKNKIGAVHLVECECITCTYNYPDKTQMLELKEMHRSMEMTYVDGDLSQLTERQLLIQMLLELRKMRQQEKDYWETWKQAKSKENTS